MAAPNARARSTVPSVDPSLTTVMSTAVTAVRARISARASSVRWMTAAILSCSFSAGMATSSFIDDSRVRRGASGCAAGLQELPEVVLRFDIGGIEPESLPELTEGLVPSVLSGEPQAKQIARSGILRAQRHGAARVLNSCAGVTLQQQHRGETAMGFAGLR